MMGGKEFADAWKLSVGGAWSAADQIKKGSSLEDFSAEKKGCGRKDATANDNNIKKVPESIAVDPRLASGGRARETGIPETTIRRIDNDLLGLKSATQVKTLHVEKGGGGRRSGQFAVLAESVDNGWALRPTSPISVDGKRFRLGEVSGGNQNYRS